MMTNMIQVFPYSAPLLFEAYYDCRKNKRNKKSSIDFEQNLESNLMQLHEELITGQWQPSEATVFAINHPKPREVWAANFRDRIVHHLVYRAIGPTFERAFIHDSCACIKGRGTLYGAQRLTQHLRSATQNWTREVYVLKADIASFFGSIRQDILFKQLQRRVNDEFLLDLLQKLVFQDVRRGAIVRGHPALMSAVPQNKSLFHAPDGVGLPIGNLSSQFFANVYLDGMDQMIKRHLGMRHYVRYVDDLIILSESKAQLAAVADAIREHLAGLGMRLAEWKTSIYPASSGVDFVGRVIRPYRSQGRPKTLRHALRRIEVLPRQTLWRTCNSYLGLFKHSGSRQQLLALHRAALGRDLTISLSHHKTYRPQPCTSNTPKSTRKRAFPSPSARPSTAPTALP